MRHVRIDDGLLVMAGVPLNSAVALEGETCEHVQCGTCGIHHAVPKVILDTLRREGGYYFCPNVHQRGWRTGAEEKEREAIRRERDVLKQNEARLATCQSAYLRAYGIRRQRARAAASQ